MIRTLRRPADLRPHLNPEAARRAVLLWWHRPSVRLGAAIAWRQAAWRRRWLGLGVAALLCLAGWTGTLLVSNRYVSSASLFADPGRGVSLEGGAEAWTAAALAALRSALPGSVALEREAGAVPPRAASEPAAAASDRLDKPAERITIAIEGPALFRVSYQAEHPDTAEQALQALVDLVTDRRPPPGQAAEAIAPALRAGAASVVGPRSQASIAAALQAKRDEAVALRNDLAAALALRDARARQLAEAAPVLAAGRRNPIYDQTAIQLGQQETLVAGLRSQLAAAAAAIDALGRQLEAGSDDDATSGNLPNRGASPAAAGASGPVFRLVGSPSRPPGPESRLRLLLLAGVATGGVVVGAAVAAWRGRLDGVVDRTSQLERRFRLPVLGTISVPRAPGEQRRRRRAAIEFGLACLGLLVLFGSLATAETLDLLAPLIAPARVPPAG